MYRRIFNNDILDTDFDKNGFVIVDNAIDNLRCKELYKELNHLDSNVKTTFYTSLWSSNEYYKKVVNEKINSELKSFVASTFYNYKPLFGDLLVKKPSLHKKFAIHQDWTFVDENIFQSVYIWIPLQDVNYLNGHLQLVRGSHKFLDKIRGANLKVSYEDIKPKIAQHFLEGQNLTAGQAVIFSQSLLHASPPNRTFNTRICMGLLMVPAEANLYHYIYDESKNTIFKLNVDVDFFLGYSNRIDFATALKGSRFSLHEGITIADEITPNNTTLTYQNFVKEYKQTNYFNENQTNIY